MSHKEYTPSAIANNILWLASREGVDITPMKLIKLVYIVYGWCLAFLDRKIFDEPIVAWQHGPVIPSVYYQFQDFGKNPIDTFAKESEIAKDGGAITNVTNKIIDPEDEDVLKVLGMVWETYGKKDAWTLRELSHEKGSPWKKAFDEGGKWSHLDDNLIKERSIEGIKKYYIEGKNA